MKGRSFLQSSQWGERADALIPGGSHTYAKGPEQFPEGMAPFIASGVGARVWDVDGNSYIEYASGLRAVTLGHGHPRVTAAAIDALSKGTNFVRPATVEVAAAERLQSLIPTAEMVKFGKNGSDVTSAAVKLARAATGRDLIAICSSDPFLSVDDWFIGTTSLSGGIPSRHTELTVTFEYNDLASVESLFDRHDAEIACVIMEAEREIPADPQFLHGVQRLCRSNGVVFVLDEMITGFRWANGGAQEVYGLSPDLSTFGKALANGYSASALVGRRDLMKLGTLGESDPGVFLLSLTHGAETHALAAAIATADAYEEDDVVARLHQSGATLRTEINQLSESKGIGDYFEVVGREPNLVFRTMDLEGLPSQPFRTLFLQETIERGLLMPSLVTSLGHGDREIAETIATVNEALDVYARALEDGVETYLRGRSVRSVFPPR